MGIISDLFSQLRKFSGKRENDDNATDVHTVYADTLGPDPEHNTVVAKGDIMDYHLKRSSLMDNIRSENSLPIHFAAMAAVSADLTPQSPNMVNWNKKDAIRSFELLRDHGGDLNAVCGYGFSAGQMQPAIEGKV